MQSDTTKVERDEDPQPLTLQQRIAALDSSHIGRVPGDPPPTRPRPEIPNRRPQVVSHNTINIPPANVNGSLTQTKVGNQPNGPPPLPSRKQPPPLPQRKSSSDDQSRRTSFTSINSTSTTATDTSLAVVSRTKSQDGGRVKAPAWGECELPPLPARNTSKKLRASEKPKQVSRVPSGTPVLPPPFIPQGTTGSATSLNPLPNFPLRPAHKPSQPSKTPPNTRRIPPAISPAALRETETAGFSSGNRRTSTASNNRIQEEDESNSPVPTSTQAPPPVPLSSRPDLSVIQATKPRPTTSGHRQVQPQTTPSEGCMTCRDFSAPDHHASFFPRQQVRSLPDLAKQLTTPFPSLTDKARAIFTWLHHNVHYDVDNFFRGTIQGSSPESTLRSGLAVCEGYAALYANLATHAGLEAIVVGGHGKGFGYTQLSPGSPLPPYDGNHAWNAVKVDAAEWKLIDPCWGAGHVLGRGQPYMPQLNPSMFTMSNEEFGIKHFPAHKDHFFLLPAGRRLTWETYIQIDADRWPGAAEPPTVFANARTDYGIGDRTVMPRDRRIRIHPGSHAHSSGQTANITRFQFSLLCPHWTLDQHTRKGPPPIFTLAVHGLDGRNKDHVPLAHVRGSDVTPSGAGGGGGGDTWYVDVATRELGCAGQTVTLFAVTSFGDRGEARGLSVREFRDGKGRVGMGFTGVAAWDLV